MASVMSTVLSRLNAFLDTEMEQVLCFEGSIDAEHFAKEKSAIFLILPEEDPSKNSMAGLLIQNLSRELFAVADENGSRTVLGGSVSRSKGKDGGSQSLQMLERPLLTPDELKALPKGEFIVTKTGSHPMRTRLRLFLDWGITFDGAYQAPEYGQRKVYYAGRQELEAAITAKFGLLQPPELAHTQGRRPKRGGVPKTVAEGLRERADLRKEGEQ